MSGWRLALSGGLRRSAEEEIDAEDCRVGKVPWEDLCKTVLKACSEIIPPKQKKANKPWISEETLKLIEEKRHVRTSGEWEKEKQLRKQVQRAAKKDRTNWLERLTSTGDWESLRIARRGSRRQQNRLRNSARWLSGI